jgi:hypothetical protein
MRGFWKFYIYGTMLPDTWVKRMRKIIARIFQLYFFGFFLFLLCCSIAGQEKGVFWFVLIAVMLLILTVVGKIAQRSSR